MKIGDMVRMNMGDDDEFCSSEWGIGIILELYQDKPFIDVLDTGTEVLVLWSEIGLSWEMPGMLELLDESR